MGCATSKSWVCNKHGKIVNGKTQSKGDYAFFKHVQPLEPEDVWRMKVLAGRGAVVGIALEWYDVEMHRKTYMFTARVELSSGTTFIYPGISEDRQDH